MKRIVIEHPHALEPLLELAAKQARVAIDLEGNGLFRYRSGLCTMQVRIGDTLAVIDTQALDDLQPLAPLLSSTGPLKIIHDVSFDARLLHAHGLPLGNVFDTALAARYLGEPGTGLQALLRVHCGVELDKELQQHDWGQRPLNPQMLHYLYEDIAYLFELHDHLQQLAISRGIDAEIATELSYTLRQALTPTGPPKPAWRRVKKAKLLSPLHQSVLRELCDLRERVAQKRDVPPFRVLHDRALIQLTHDMPNHADALRQGRNSLPVNARPLIADLLEAIATGRENGSPPDCELDAANDGPSSTERTLKRQTEKALSSWRRQEAESRGVDSQVVLPGHGLSDLVARQPKTLSDLHAIDGLGDVRIQRYGLKWLAILQSPA